MRQNLRRFHAFIAKMIAFVAIAAVSIPAMAQQQTVELGELSFGVEYTAAKNTITTGFFTVKKTGTLTIVFSNNAQNRLYSDPDFTTVYQGKHNHNYAAPALEYEVSEGTTYYVRYFLTQYDTPFTFLLAMEGEDTVPFFSTFVSPAPKDPPTNYDVNYNNELYVQFSNNVQDYEAELIYRANNGKDITVNMTPSCYTVNTYLYVRLGEELLSLMNNDGAEGISPNAPFTVRVKATDKYGQTPSDAEADGFLSYDYLCGWLPVTYVETYWPEEFLSYWPKGDDAGIAWVKYSEDLRTEPAPYGVIHIGNLDDAVSGGYYEVRIPATVEGGKVSVDLTGVRRNIKDIFSKDVSVNHVTVEIKSLYSKNNVPVVSNTPGTTATYTANLPFKNLEKAEVRSDYFPMLGANLANYNEIEVWITELNNIIFDGFTVESVNKGVTSLTEIPMSAITVSDEAPNGSEAVYTFAIPTEAKTADAVYVYPTNLESVDGYDYSVYLKATYNTMVATYSVPMAGADIAELTGSTIEAGFNYSVDYPNMFVTLEIVDQNPVEGQEPIVFEEKPMTKQTDGSYALTIDNKLKLYYNHTYNAYFKGWATESDYNSGAASIGTATVVWFGSTPAYVNSTTILESINPDETTPLCDTNATFTLKFDNVVRIDSDYSYYIPFMTEPQEYLSMTPDSETAVSNNGYTYATEWTITIDQQYIAADYLNMTLVLAVLDSDDIRLEGNAGFGEDSYFEFTYLNDDTSAVEEILPATEGYYEVYTLTGIKVLSTTDYSQILTLSPAIYIINGKKVKI